MKEVFVFDVDGTLTPPRQRIVPEFARFFGAFVKLSTTYLVSGSDLNKLQEQLQKETFSDCEGVFTCSGAEFWSKNKLIYRRNHEFQSSLVDYLNSYVADSPYAHRFGNHIEQRPGMLNVSVVGRRASIDQRKAYHEWDATHGERSKLVNHIVNNFPEYEASAGGEISVDVVPTGWNKSVTLSEILNRHPNAAITFFGDRMSKEGNDRPLADALVKSPHHKAIPVNGFRETWRYLCELAHSTAA